MKVRLFAFLVVFSALGLPSTSPADGWKRHTIDGSSGGADGTRLADVNGDGFKDIVTAWEQGGVIRVYIHPGRSGIREPWPTVTVGKVAAGEDAVFVDLDEDGAVDVVSSCEGRTRAMFVHWAPRQPDAYMTAEAWTTERIPSTDNQQSWMFALPMQMDGQGGIDLVVGSKGRDASISWLQAPSDPRKLSGWQLRPLRASGWIMSLVDVDMDEDGDLDILASDRKGPTAGVFWLENPGPRRTASGAAWKEHEVGRPGEVMFLTVGDLDQDGVRDIVAAVHKGGIAYWRGTKEKDRPWEFHTIPLPAGSGTGKSVALGDLNGDERPDIVFTCEGAKGPASGVRWLSSLQPALDDARWLSHEIGGPLGVKYDLGVLEDVDSDGDLDVITSEESEKPELGVVWYENPAQSASRRKGKARRPNILFIVADDLGYECLGAYGGTSYTTPHIDALAASGLRFLNAFSGAVDQASQVSMITGNYPFRHGAEWGRLSNETPTFGQVMARARYQTALAGKWPFVPLKKDPLHARRQGFGEDCSWSPQDGPRLWRPVLYQNGRKCFGVSERYGPDVHCDFLVDFIRRHATGSRRFQRFFAYYPMTLPHLARPDAPAGPDGRHPTYAEMVTQMDRLVGKLVATLEEVGLREQTLVVFTAENGSPANVTSRLGKRPRRGGKGTLSDSGTHVPLIASWPRTIAPGKVCDDLVDASDYFATFLDLAEGRLPSGTPSLDGRSFAPRLRGNAKGSRRWVYLHGAAGRRSIRDQRWKLYNDGRLFDLVADSEEAAPIQPTDDAPDTREARRQLDLVLKRLAR